MLGIFAVALNLAVAVVAAVNATLALHLSLRPEQNPPNIEARLVFCMIALLGIAVISGSSLILLSIHIDILFTAYLGSAFVVGLLLSFCCCFELFDLNSLKRLTPLSLLSLFLSTLAFILAVARPDTAIGIWITITSYHLTLIYHLFIVIKNNPSRPDEWSVILHCLLGSLWTFCSFWPAFFGQGSDYVLACGSLVSGLEALTFAYIGIFDKLISYKRKGRRQPQRNLAEA